MSLQDVLAGLTHIHGVRGALVVSLEDGLVVADALMEDVNGNAVAALAANLANRMASVTAAVGQPAPQLWQLSGSEGTLVAAPGSAGLLLVAVADSEVNAGELRLQLLNAAERAA